MTAVKEFPPKQIPREEPNLPALDIEGFDFSKPHQSIKAADLLKKFTIDQKLVIQIQDRSYALMEAWQYIGMLFNCYAVVVAVINESTYEDKVYKWHDRRNNPKEVKTKAIKYRAIVEVRRLSDDKLLSRGENVVTNDEFGKHDWAEYAVLSMAQTRAQGKAWRLLLGWMMKAAGFEPTPAEEMDTARKEFLENCPTPEEKRMLINLAYSARWNYDNPKADEEKRIEALATIAGCVDYDLFAKIEHRLRELQPSISEIQNPSQKDINQHLRQAIQPDAED